MKRKKQPFNTYIWIIGLISLAIMILFIQARWSMTGIASTPPLQPPYIRLIASTRPYNIGQKIPVNVHLHTNGLSTVETVIAIRFDETKLALAKPDIINADIYPVINVELMEPGLVLFSLFTDTDLGYPRVSTLFDTLVAHLMFTALEAAPSGTTIDLVMDNAKGDFSGMYAIRMTPDQPVKNILKQVGSATIRIEQ